MNSVFALMIITATGVTEAPNNFATMKDCQYVSDKLKVASYCVEKKPVDVQGEFSKMIAMMKMFQKEMDK